MVLVQQKTASTSSILTIIDNPLDECVKLLIRHIIWVSTVTPFYHLEFFCEEEIFIGILLQIINLLLDLDSLKVWSLSLIQSTCLSDQELQSIRHVSNNNKITKVHLENIIKFEKVLFLIDLFPHMIYLQVDCENNIDIELFVRVSYQKHVN